MILPPLKSLVNNGQKVHFSFYRDGELWYKVSKSNFEFPIRGDDLKGATFKAEDKAILFMRWIKAHLDYLQEAHENLSRLEGLADLERMPPRETYDVDLRAAGETGVGRDTSLAAAAPRRFEGEK